MKRHLLGCFALLALASCASAQDPFVREARQQEEELIPALPQLAPESMTPEMYVYMQELRRHDDPAQAVRRKAEFKATQRMNRLATMKWFGMSNARPQASPVPMMGVYSPSWVGNGADRYDWVGVGYPSASVYIEANTIRR